MIHQFRDKKQILRKKKIIKNIIIFILFFVLSILGFFIWSGKIFIFIGKPIWKSEKIILNEFNNSEYLIRSKKSVFFENENLLKENTDLKTSMIDYSVIKDENLKLKELFGRIPEGQEMILSSILTKPNHSPYDTILIDIGENLGVKEGQRVYADGYIPIGSVSKVYSNTSLVNLYSNPGQKTEGILEGSNANVELIGRGGGNFEMLIPIDLSSNEGTKILIPGIDNEIIAYVNKIISSPTDPMKKVLLSSPINIQNLKWVEIKK